MENFCFFHKKTLLLITLFLSQPSHQARSWRQNQTKLSAADRLFFFQQIPPLKLWQTMAHQRFVCTRLPFQGGQFKRHIQCILAHTESTICTLLPSSQSQISSARGGAFKSVTRLTFPRCYVYSNFIRFPLN